MGRQTNFRDQPEKILAIAKHCVLAFDGKKFAHADRHTLLWRRVNSLEEASGYRSWVSQPSRNRESFLLLVIANEATRNHLTMEKSLMEQLDRLAQKEAMEPETASVGSPRAASSIGMRERARSADLQARRLLSSRASSILDVQDDEDDLEDEPELEVITDDEGNSESTESSSDQKAPNSTGSLDSFLGLGRSRSVPSKPGSKDLSTPSTAKSAKAYSGDTEEQSPTKTLVKPPREDVSSREVDKLTCFADGVTSYFCSSTVDSSEADAIRIQIQTNSTMQNAGHSRTNSEDASGAAATSNSERWPSALCGTQQRSFSMHESGDLELGKPAVCIPDIQHVIATDISAILGSSVVRPGHSDWLSTLRDWMTEPTYCSPRSGNILSKGARRRVVRNRVGLRHDQKHRMQHLWLQWHAKANDDEHSTTNNKSPRAAGPPRLWSIGATQSLDDMHVVESVPRAAFPLSTTELYYDSDPEVFRRSRNRGNRASKTAVVGLGLPSPINTAASFSSTGHGRPPLTPRNSSQRRAPSFDATSSMSAEEQEKGIDLQNDQMVSEFLVELTLGKVSLTLHPSSVERTPERDGSEGVVRNKIEPTFGSSHETPIAVQGWFEMGSRLEKKVIQPKFMWRENYQPNLSRHRKLRTSCRTPDSIDLLSMVRILCPTSLDRQEYPFAKVDHSFLILANSDDAFLFEAQSRQERNWIAHGLKLVVARLASMIIVGDEQMFVEFFSPWAHAPVPESKTRDGEEDEDGDNNNNNNKEESAAQTRTSVVPLGVVTASSSPKARASLWGTLP